MTDKGAEIVTPLRFDWHQYEQVRSALDEAHVEIDAIHTTCDHLSRLK